VSRARAAAQLQGPARAPLAPLGGALAVTARGLARGSRRAWMVALALLAALFVLHVERRFDEGAIVTGLVIVGLVGRRSDFGRRGDRGSRRLMLLHAALGAAAPLVYGLTT